MPEKILFYHESTIVHIEADGLLFVSSTSGGKERDYYAKKTEGEGENHSESLN